MYLRIRALIVASLLVGSGFAEAGELANRGIYNEFFFDPATGLTWCDPDLLVGADRIELDGFVTRNSVGWVWATGAQVDALVGSTSQLGYDLEGIMGPAQAYVGAGAPRWVGYHAGTSPDGWLVQADDEPFVVLTQSGSQGGAAAWDPGGWLVNPADPAALPRLENRGLQLQFFHDQGTGLNWCDPELFVGLTRAEVADWLAAHTNWRWATAAEVAALVGRMAEDYQDLVQILGEPQFRAGEYGLEPRWIGYYAQADEPDGLLLESNLVGYNHIVTTFGTQTGAAAWQPGAWVVTEGEPTRTERKTWGSVKGSYR
ncbi:MAG: hypothetical protein IH621_18215 [Krumholzibacteria bacterium]|nr:hypothetical protein [Candidatus Krumholzibacteria bacterium]